MYLVVIYDTTNYYCEEEPYYFDTKKEMLKFFNYKSIREILKKENNSTVYKIEKIYKNEKERRNS